jgi:hypothetical protein
MDQSLLEPVHGNASDAGRRAPALQEPISPPAGKMAVIEYGTIHGFVNGATATAS